MSTPHRCMITGMGVLTSIGQSLAEFSHSLKTGRSGIGTMGRFVDANLPVAIAAGISNFSFDDALNHYDTLSPELLKKAKRSARRSPFAVQTAVLAALEAWKEAKLDSSPVAPERIGIVVAGSNLSQQYQYEMRAKYQDNPEYLAPSYALHFLDTDHVGTLSEIFEIQGEGFTVGGASASGNIGIIKGSQLIRMGIVDVCLVVGALADLSPMEVQGFSSIGAMGGKKFADSPERACRPFDKEHEGFIFGQGCGCLVLESAASAEERGAEAFAEYMGGGIILDANRLSDPTEKGEAKAMRTALAEAGLTAADVDYINAHATSSPLGDITEVQAIRQVFGDRVRDVWINGTKSLTGHCLYAAGTVEAIATILQMREGFVHPNLNLDNPIDSDCRFAGGEAVAAELNIAMSNSFGFGGINSSIILKKGV